MENQELTDFQQFCKLNDKYIHFEKPTSKFVNGRFAIAATMKLLEDSKNNEIFLNETDKCNAYKLLEEFHKSLEDKANTEIDEITNNIKVWLTNLIERIFIFNNKEVTKEYVEEVRVKIMDFLNETSSGLNTETIYYLVKTFYII